MVGVGAHLRVFCTNRPVHGGWGLPFSPISSKNGNVPLEKIHSFSKITMSPGGTDNAIALMD
jgi:hypothetical protein